MGRSYQPCGGLVSRASLIARWWFYRWSGNASRWMVLRQRQQLVCEESYTLWL